MNVGGTFFVSEAVKDFFSLIQALLFPMNAQSVLNGLATPFFEINVFLDDLVEFNGDNEAILTYLRDEHNLHEIFGEYVEKLRIMPVFAVVRQLMTGNVLQNLYTKKLNLLNEIKEIDKIKIKLEIEHYQKNLNHIMDLLHQEFDSTNATLFGIYSWLDIQIKTNREEDEPRLNEINSEEVVEIVTVHKSKGLEFHTVIMPLTDQPFDFERDEILFDDNKQSVGWYVKSKQFENDAYHVLNDIESDETVKEETRLLYVAMTRTRERLLIFKPRKSKDQTWSMLLDV